MCYHHPRIRVQVKECIDSAREVVKYFKNKTVVHSLLDKARKHVKVSFQVLQCFTWLNKSCDCMLCKAQR